MDECHLNDLVDQVLRQLNQFCSGGSGWFLGKFMSLDIKVCKTKLLAGSTFLQTPTKVACFRYKLLTIKNLSDNFCFIYCILAIIYPSSENRERPSNYSDKFDRYIFDRSFMPMNLRIIPKLETNNRLVITVFKLADDGSLFCCHRSKMNGNSRKIFLFFLTIHCRIEFSLLLDNDFPKFDA